MQTTQQKGEETYLDVNGATQCTSSMPEEKNLQSTTNTSKIMLKKNGLKKKTHNRGRKKKRLKTQLRKEEERAGCTNVFKKRAGVF